MRRQRLSALALALDEQLAAALLGAACDVLGFRARFLVGRDRVARGGFQRGESCIVDRRALDDAALAGSEPAPRAGCR